MTPNARKEMRVRSSPRPAHSKSPPVRIPWVGHSQGARLAPQVERFPLHLPRRERGLQPAGPTFGPFGIPHAPLSLGGLKSPLHDTITPLRELLPPPPPQQLCVPPRPPRLRGSSPSLVTTRADEGRERRAHGPTPHFHKCAYAGSRTVVRGESDGVTQTIRNERPSCPPRRDRVGVQRNNTPKNRSRPHRRAGRFVGHVMRI
jgi:hypothetical protein